MLKVATVFSGIGAIEFALKRMNIEHEVVFACDNGEREVEIDYEKEKVVVDALSSPQEKKEYVEKLYAQKTKSKNYMQESYVANYPIKDNMFFSIRTEKEMEREKIETLFEGLNDVSKMN